MDIDQRKESTRSGKSLRRKPNRQTNLSIIHDGATLLRRKLTSSTLEVPVWFAETFMISTWSFVIVVRGNSHELQLPGERFPEISRFKFENRIITSEKILSFEGEISRKPGLMQERVPGNLVERAEGAKETARRIIERTRCYVSITHPDVCVIWLFGWLAS